VSSSVEHLQGQIAFRFDLRTEVRRTQLWNRFGGDKLNMRLFRPEGLGGFRKDAQQISRVFEVGVKRQFAQ
jgi:hypothetical protein